MAKDIKLVFTPQVPTIRCPLSRVEPTRIVRLPQTTTPSRSRGGAAGLPSLLRMSLSLYPAGGPIT